MESRVVESRVVEILSLVWVFTILAILVVAVRLVSRLKIKPAAGWDDVAISATLAFDVAYTILTTYAVSQGAGKRITELSPEGALSAIKWSFITNCVGVFTFSTPKVAIALLLGRVLAVGTVSRVEALILYIPAAIIMAWAVGAEIFYTRQCNPVSGNWNKEEGARCLNPHDFVVFVIIYGAYSTFLDFAYAIYPIVRIASLKMETRKKVGFSIMLGLGVAGGAVSIYKLSQVPGLTSPKADPTYDTGILLLLTSLEANVIILAACIPTIGPFVRGFRSTVTGSGVFSGLRNKKSSRHSYKQFSFERTSVNHSQNSGEPLQKPSSYELTSTAGGALPGEGSGGGTRSGITPGKDFGMGRDEIAIQKQVDIAVTKDRQPGGRVLPEGFLNV